MNIRRFLLRRCCAAALTFPGLITSAPAAFDEGLPPTVDEAHEFLGGTFQRYSIAYAGKARYAMPQRAVAYGGDGCTSQFAADRRNLARKVDWSGISSVEASDGNKVEFVGMRAGDSFRLYFPNERAARSAANAFEVLRSACVPPALTARR